MLDAHRRYFARQASREGCELDDEILTVFERFDVVWPLNVKTPNAAAVKMDAWLTFGAQYRDGLGPGFSQSQVLGRAISCGVGCWLLRRRVSGSPRCGAAGSRYRSRASVSLGFIHAGSPPAGIYWQRIGGCAGP